MIYYEYFDVPSTGRCFEYEALISNRAENEYTAFNEKSFSFGFCSGENHLLTFYVENGKLYDNDNNFVYHFGKGQAEGMELYGNVFSDYHNYSIDRVPVNLNCSKEVQPDSKNYVDGMFYTTTGINIALKAFGENADAVY